MLSVIIVSYNVRFFLEQCLYAVSRASQHLAVEVIVVDNHSSDGTISYLTPLFPSVTWIVNDVNAGFGRACNQGLAKCTGELVLFLNPDTLIPEDSLAKCIHYLQETPAAGALGVPMINGRGKYLPESKRSFPAPLASFYKLSGLATLFPSSGHFNRYALGNRDAWQTQEIEVLAGAFFMCRKKVLDITGGFDERFFLYAEDIDLSYRIRQAGWQTHYFAGTSIIHFKGKSRGSEQAAHVKHFYSSMLLFVEKHYHTRWSAAYRLLIRCAILLRAFFAYAGRAMQSLLSLPAATSLRKTDSIIAVADVNELEELQQQFHSSGREIILHPVIPGADVADIVSVAHNTGSRELIFCIGSKSLSDIINLTKDLSGAGLHFLFHISGSKSIVGSDQPQASGRPVPA
jgi:GT2 family glycosyltransferase